jgi:hypothetical protein
MKCVKHEAEAVGVCAHCGRALCAACAPAVPLRLTCSKSCTAALTQNEKALQALLRKHLQGARINAFFYLLCGVLSLAGAVGANYYLPSPFLIWFCAGCGVVFTAAGIWSAQAAR